VDGLMLLIIRATGRCSAGHGRCLALRFTSGCALGLLLTWPRRHSRYMRRRTFRQRRRLLASSARKTINRAISLRSTNTWHDAAILTLSRHTARRARAPSYLHFARAAHRAAGTAAPLAASPPAASFLAYNAPFALLSGVHLASPCHRQTTWPSGRAWRGLRGALLALAATNLPATTACCDSWHVACGMAGKGHSPPVSGATSSFVAHTRFSRRTQRDPRHYACTAATGHIYGAAPWRVRRGFPPPPRHLPPFLAEGACTIPLDALTGLSVTHFMPFVRFAVV